MRHTKTVTVETTDYLTCDFCGVTLSSNTVTLNRAKNELIERNEISFTEVDCCGICWDMKVLPALKSLGAKPRTHRIEM